MKIATLVSISIVLIIISIISSKVSADCIGGFPAHPFNGTLTSCPMYQDSACCTESSDDVVADQLASVLATLQISTESCCYSLIQSLICGLTCSPNTGNFSQVAGINGQGVATINAFVCQDWCESTFAVCQNIILPGQTNMTFGQYVTNILPSNPAGAFCGFFSTSNDPNYVPSPSNPIINVNPSSEPCFTGDICNEPNCGLDPTQSPIVETLSSSACGSTSQETCCDQQQQNMLQNKLNNLAIQFGPMDSCCFERINELLCAQGCDATSGYHSQYMGTNQNGVSSFTTYVCPSFCNDTYNACSTAPVLYVPTSTYIPMSVYFNITYPNIDPAAVFCDLFSTDKNSSYVPSPTLPIVDVVSETRMIGNTEICYPGDQATCSDLTPPQHCGTDPFRYPNKTQILVGCPAYSNQSCCIENADVEIAFKTQDPKSFFTGYFGLPTDCCNHLITQILCSSACSPTGGTYTRVSLTNTDVNNVTLYVCEDHCRATYAACKDHKILGTSLETLLTDQNPTEPWAAMCAFFSSENDPTYTPRPDRPNFKARMGFDPYTGVCFTGPQPYCEPQNVTGSSSVIQGGSSTENSTSSFSYSLLLIISTLLLGLVAINF